MAANTKCQETLNYVIGVRGIMGSFSCFIPVMRALENLLTFFSEKDNFIVSHINTS